MCYIIFFSFFWDESNISKLIDGYLLDTAGILFAVLCATPFGYIISIIQQRKPDSKIDNKSNIIIVTFLIINLFLIWIHFLIFEEVLLIKLEYFNYLLRGLIFADISLIIGTLLFFINTFYKD